MSLSRLSKLRQHQFHPKFQCMHEVARPRTGPNRNCSHTLILSRRLKRRQITTTASSLPLSRQIRKNHGDLNRSAFLLRMLMLGMGMGTAMDTGMDTGMAMGTDMVEAEAEVGAEVVAEAVEAQRPQQQLHPYLLLTRKCSSKVPRKWQHQSGQLTMHCRQMAIMIQRTRIRQTCLLAEVVALVRTSRSVVLWKGMISLPRLLPTGRRKNSLLGMACPILGRKPERSQSGTPMES